MKYSIVTNQKIMDSIKKSKYFKVNLGLVNTIDKNGERIYNERDKFAHFYNTQYKTTIHGQGYVGDIMFYLDHYVKEDVLAVYLNTDEFIFKFDEKTVKEKGPDFYLGYILKELETQYEERIKEAELKKLEPKRQIDPTLVNKNPGAVTYDDIQAYLKKKQAERYLVSDETKKD